VLVQASDEDGTWSAGLVRAAEEVTARAGAGEMGGEGRIGGVRARGVVHIRFKIRQALFHAGRFQGGRLSGCVRRARGGGQEGHKEYHAKGQ